MPSTLRCLRCGAKTEHANGQAVKCSTCGCQLAAKVK